jgi:nucleoside phosphorylase
MDRQMSDASVGRDIVDALIVTAVREECDAVLTVETGAVRGSEWEPRAASTELELFIRVFQATGGTLRIAVTRAFDLGLQYAVMAAAPLLGQYPGIRCLAMCGVCAGRRGDVNLGDVIIADRTWPYDSGKLKVTYDDRGTRIERLQGDMQLYRIEPPGWKQLAERFKPDPESAWIAERPRSYEAQGQWLLERLVKEQSPAQHTDRNTMCPDYHQVVKQLWKVKWLEDGYLNLTEAGRRYIERLLILHPAGPPEAEPFKVAMGPIASGAPVLEDPGIFDRLATESGMRKVLGLEMETSAILSLAYLQRLPFAVVMKGVMDHADIFKRDNMKAFAAKASAECLIAFLRKNLPPAIEELPPLRTGVGTRTSGQSDDPSSIEFSTLIQADIAIETYKTAEEINRRIEGVKLTASSAFEEQYEFMQLSRALRRSRGLVDQITNSRPATFDAGLFPESVTLRARFRATSTSKKMITFYIREQSPRELIPDPDETSGIVIWYKALAESRVDLKPGETRYVDLNVSLYYLDTDYPEFSRREGRGDLDLQAVFYLLGAQAIRNRLIRGTQAGAAIPIDVQVLFSDGLERQIHFKMQTIAIPGDLKSWKCDILSLEKGLQALHEAVDPFYTLQCRTSLLREIRKVPDENIVVMNRDVYAQSLQQIRDIVGKVHPNPAQAQKSVEEQEQDVVASVAAYRRGEYD